MDLKKPAVPQTRVEETRTPGTRPVPGRTARTGRFTRERREPAWWTARATAGEVTPGFSKAEILRPKAEDPRAPDGILERVEALLDVLDEGSSV
jgi:hypothetical protein